MKKLLLDRTLLVICGIGSCILLDPILSRGATMLSALIAPWDEYLRMGVIVLIGTAFWWGVASLGGFRIWDLWSRTTLRFPPVWICGVVAAVIFSFIADNLRTPQQCYFENILKSDILCILIAPIFASLLIRVKRNSLPPVGSVPDNITAPSERATGEPVEPTCETRRTDALPATNETPFENGESLIQWLQKEKPIHHPDQDCFKAAPIARRIARLLLNTPLRTIGLVGNYGVGKSSVLNLVEHYLNNTALLEQGASPSAATPRFPKRQPIICRVGAWGYKGTAAAQNILKAAIGALSKEVDCLGLATLPSHYGSAIAAVDAGWTKPLGGILGRQTDPVEVLMKLDRVVGQAKLRLVVFIEDLDRNPDEDELFGVVVSLLDRLKDLQNVSFLLAIARGKASRHDLLRICEHLEDIPNMPEESALGVFVQFRNQCLTKFAEDQDCLKQDVRDQLLGNTSSISFRRMLGQNRETILSCIARVANTPRMLKSILSRTWWTWQSLHGELDFDNLVVANVLRDFLPEGFKFIVENIDRFQRIATSEGLRDRDDKDRSDLQADWTQFTKEASWDTTSGGILISFLFPGSLLTRAGDILVPQGLAQATPTDYWRRYTAEEVAAGDIRDQEILRALSAWRINNEDIAFEQQTLATAVLEVPGVADRVEHFGGLLDAEEIRALASQLFEKFLQGERKRPEGDFGRGEPPGFVQLWRLSMDHPSANHADWIADEIARALPVSLRFANDLYYFWRSDNKKSIEVKQIRTPEVRATFVNRGREIFEKQPEALLRALEADCSYCVYQFAVLYSSTDEGGQGFDPQEWKWLANVLLDAVEMNPQLVIPEIAVLLVDSQQTRTGGHVHSLKEDITDGLFGDSKERLMRNLAREIDLEPLAPLEQGQVSFIWKYAEKWLEPEQP